MFIPVVLVALAAIGLASGRGRDAKPSKMWFGAALPAPAKSLTSPRPHLAALIILTRRGVEVPPWVVDEAINESYECGDVKTAVSLFERFKHESDVVDTKEESPSEPGETVTVSGKSSPFDGVSNQEWEEFVSRLATHGADFSSDKHLGKYHHSRERLRNLGLDPKTEEEQDEALEADLSDLRDKAGDVIRNFMALEVEVDGKTHVITLSGILGLLKAAGVEGAQSWLSNPKDRTKFPKTTETFIATNGVF